MTFAVGDTDTVPSPAVLWVHTCTYNNVCVLKLGVNSLLIILAYTPAVY